VQTEDRLRELLRRADADAGPPPTVARDLPGRVLLRESRFRRRIALASSAAAAVFLVIGITTLWRANLPKAVADVERAEIVQLQHEADSQAKIARRVAELRQRDERLAVLRAAAARPDPVQRAQQQVDQTALTLLQQGDHLYRDLGLPQPAADSYRRTVRLFPQTRWAGLAQQRLHEMATEKGDML
jgi:tetratricopeptide (TPR) repeat protein